MGGETGRPAVGLTTHRRRMNEEVGQRRTWESVGRRRARAADVVVIVRNKHIKATTTKNTHAHVARDIPCLAGLNTVQYGLPVAPVAGARAWHWARALGFAHALVYSRTTGVHRRSGERERAHTERAALLARLRIIYYLYIYRGIYICGVYVFFCPMYFLRDVYFHIVYTARSIFMKISIPAYVLCVFVSDVCLIKKRASLVVVLDPIFHRPTCHLYTSTSSTSSTTPTTTSSSTTAAAAALCVAARTYPILHACTRVRTLGSKRPTAVPDSPHHPPLLQPPRDSLLPHQICPCRGRHDTCPSAPSGVASTATQPEMNKRHGAYVRSHGCCR